jgi:CheY-like chemotaxis protein
MTEPIRILVVDDLLDWQKSISGLLSDEGYDVRSVGSRVDALEALDAGRFHVAVLDVRLDERDESNQDGLVLMHEIREKYPSVAVIILTGYANIEMVREALEPDDKGESPAFGFLQKTETDQLLEYVRRASLRQQLPTFEPGQECEITVSLEPGQRLLVRGRGSIRFTHTSTNPLSLDPASFMRWGSERMMSTADRRFLIKETGQKLYRLLFEQHSPVINGYHRALGSVTKKQYLHLVFESTRELAGVPLEFLFSEDAGGYLTLLHPLVHQIRKVVTRHSPISAEFIRRLVGSGEKLRVLLLISNTKPRIDLIDETGEQLKELLSPVSWLDLTYVKTEAATYHEVQEMLRGGQHHIVHYVGHGGFHEASPEQSRLFFWEDSNRSGHVMPMTGNELRFLLQDSDTRLFHLTCCEGTRAGDASDLLDDDYLGIADGIIQAGVPSVLGYRWPVSAGRAQEMTLAFYRSLLRHGSPELALLDARRELAARKKDDLTWASPILIVQS